MKINNLLEMGFKYWVGWKRLQNINLMEKVNDNTVKYKTFKVRVNDGKDYLEGIIDQIEKQAEKIK